MFCWGSVADLRDIDGRGDRDLVRELEATQGVFELEVLLRLRA